MSYSHTFDDYLRDVRMELSRRYFVAAPSRNELTLPRLFDCTYSFEAEQKARRAYVENKTAKENPPPPLPRIQPREGTPSTENNGGAAAVLVPSLLPSTSATAVLVPSKPVPSLPSVASTFSLSSMQPTPQTFEDFEGVASVFDELELKSFDDRTALHQIWGAVQMLPNSTVAYSAATASAGVQRTAPPPPSRTPAFSQGHVSTTSAPLPVLRNGYPSKPLPALPTATDHASSANGIKPLSTEKRQTASQAMLAAKLTTKGFRSHIVNLCVTALSQDQMPYIEYYVKGVTNMEKRAVDAQKGLDFLLQSQLTDKQDVLRYSDTVVQLVTMGFPAEKAMLAAREAKGDRVLALEKCL